MPENKISKKYTNVSIRIMEEDYDLAMSYISDHPFLGIEEKYDELIVTFNSEDWNDDLKNALIKKLKNIDPDIQIIQENSILEKNWNEEYEKNIPAIKVNDNIGFAPEWKKDEIDTKIKILINPKMSFGTGDHESTRLISILAEKSVNPASFWIDVGTGTGVLAILAIKLGAEKVYAFDNNEWSVDNSKENFILNNVEDRIQIKQEDIDEIELPSADGIFANLFRHLLLQNLDKFYRALKQKNGNLLISGILKYDFKKIREEAEKSGFVLIDSIAENDWIAAHFKIEGSHNE